MQRRTFVILLQSKRAGSPVSKSLQGKRIDNIPLNMIDITLHALRKRGIRGKADLYINIPHGCFCAEENYVRSVLL